MRTREPVVARQSYRIVNPDAQDYTRLALWIAVITKDDDPDVSPCRVLRLDDGSVGVFWRDELEAYSDEALQP